MLRLARATGRSEAELMAMSASRLLWWLEGVAEIERHGGAREE